MVSSPDSTRAWARRAESPIIRCTRPDSTARYIPPPRVAADLHDGEALRLHRVGEPLDVVAAAERVDDVGEMRLLAQDVLRRDRDARPDVRRARQHLVVAVRVQRLQAAEDARHGL